MFACLQTFTVSDDDNDDVYVYMINEVINFDQTSVAVLFFDITISNFQGILTGKFFLYFIRSRQDKHGITLISLTSN